MSNDAQPRKSSARRPPTSNEVGDERYISFDGEYVVRVVVAERGPQPGTCLLHRKWPPAERCKVYGDAWWLYDDEVWPSRELARRYEVTF